MTGAEMWAIFLAYANKPQHRELLNEIIATKEEIKMAYGLLTSISQDEDERARFRARRKFQMDMEHSRIVSFEEGENKGRIDGELKGRTKSKLEIARNLLSNKVSLDIISRSTGLSLDEIQTLTN